MIPTILIAIFGLLITFIVTFIVMPYVIKAMKKRNIVGVDVHKVDKPKVAEMGGVGILIGVTSGGIVLFALAGIFITGIFDLRILIFLSVVLLAGLIGIVDDVKTLGPRFKPILTAVACLPILLYTWAVIGLGLSPPLMPAYVPNPYLPFLGRTRLTYVYPLLVPLAIAIPANAVNMMDVFNGVMPLTSIFMFVALLFVSLFLMAAGVPGTELGVLLSAVMIGALIAYYAFNRYPAKVFAGDTGSLAVGGAIGAIAILGRVEIMAIVALLPAIMNAFYSLVSVGGLFERRQKPGRSIIQDDGTLAADPDAPITLTNLVRARGALTEQRITLSLATLSLASSVLAILTVLLIPFDTGYLLTWPAALILVIVPICLIFGVYLALRKKDHLGLRVAGLITIMVCVWILGMAGFALLDFLIVYIQSAYWPIIGILYMVGWLALWHFATRLYYRYEMGKNKVVTQPVS